MNMATTLVTYSFHACPPEFTTVCHTRTEVSQKDDKVCRNYPLKNITHFAYGWLLQTTRQCINIPVYHTSCQRSFTVWELPSKTDSNLICGGKTNCIYVPDIFLPHQRGTDQPSKTNGHWCAPDGSFPVILPI